MFLVGVGHMRDSSGISGGQKYSNSHFVLTHTIAYLLIHLIVVRLQSDLQLFHLFLETEFSFSGSWARCVYLTCPTFCSSTKFQGNKSQVSVCPHGL